MSSADHGLPEDADEDQKGTIVSNEEWCEWLRKDLRSSPVYATHSALLDECCDIAARWRARFWERKALWGRIRRGRRLAKELAEVAPVIARTRAAIEALSLPEGSPKVVILDLCSGFGYLGMFLSELLPAEKVERIVLVDIMWAPHNVERQEKHLNPEHVLDPNWPIRLTTSRADLKIPSDRRILARAFLAHGAPAMILGVHLCGMLSLRCVDLYNSCPGFFFLALKPCCLPKKLFANRGDVFEGANGHWFAAAAVAVVGKWNQGNWHGASRIELERKYHIWVANLSKCVECAEGLGDGDEGDGNEGDGNEGDGNEGDGNKGDGGTVASAAAAGTSLIEGRTHEGKQPVERPRYGNEQPVERPRYGNEPPVKRPSARAASCVVASSVVVETHSVQSSWFLNKFVFATRAWSCAPPSFLAGGAPTAQASAAAEERRAARLAEYKSQRRKEKHERRLANKSVHERAEIERLRPERELRDRRVTLTITPLSCAQLQLRCWLEVHTGTFVELR